MPRIDTGDETWIHYYDPLTKRQSVEWHRQSRQARRNSRCRVLWVKSRLTSAGTVKVNLLVEFWETSATINSQKYADIKEVKEFEGFGQTGR